MSGRILKHQCNVSINVPLVPFGLGTEPVLVQVWLKCGTSEHNFSVNDMVAVGLGADVVSVAYGTASTADATNINVRLTSQSYVFSSLSKTTGASVALTNGDWKIIIRACRCEGHRNILCRVEMSSTTYETRSEAWRMPAPPL
jgi:hypothetical protein